MEQVSALLHDKEDALRADSGSRGTQSGLKRNVHSHMAGRPSGMAKMQESRAKAKACKLAEHQKASIRAKGGAPVSGSQTAVRPHEGEIKGTEHVSTNTAHVITLLALSKPVDGA
ncbi:hypothetical protein GmRootV213_28470 [Variovorax sp. V213]